MDTEEIYPCVGICTADPDSGYCLGCGRPPLDAPLVVQIEASPQGQAENEPAGEAEPPDAAS